MSTVTPVPSVGAAPAMSIWSAAGALLAMQNQAQPLTRKTAGETLPLSFAQERLWHLEQSEPGTPYYNVPLAWEIHGPLDISALERSLDFLVQRHEPLRTSFPDAPGGPVQRINDFHLALPVIDLSKEPGDCREAALREAAAYARLPFCLAAGPLVRAAVYRFTPHRFLLVFVVHQMVFDGGSMRILSRELADCYRAFARRTAPALAPLPIRYSDFAQWQRECLQGPVLDASLEYWRGQLQRPCPPMRLRTDHPRPHTGLAQGAQARVAIPKRMMDELKKLSLAEGATPFAASLASLAVLLARHTGQEEFILLVSTGGRTQPELRNLIGLITNLVPVRLDLSGHPDFRQLLRRASEASAAALAHQLLPLGRILELMPAPAGDCDIPTLQVLMMYSQTPLPALELEGVAFTPVHEVTNGTARLDLAFEISDSPQGLVGQLKYRADLFKPDTIAQLLRDWEHTLEECLAEPDRPIREPGAPASLPATSLGAPASLPATPPGAPPSPPATPPGAPASLPATRSRLQSPGQDAGVPRNDLERKLVRIWESVFNIRSIGIHDNFFGLGGHSLVALKLITAIESELGRKLRLSTIFAEPTIARLAEALHLGREGENTAIVEIQPQGTRSPLFLVHGVGGGMFWGYRNLARHLGADQPVYGFKSRGLDGLPEFTRIEDMAAHYVAELRRFQPQGPYLLGGYCFGGNVAYEMACQLNAQQQRVGLLALVNCWPNNSSYTQIRWTPLFLAKALGNFSLRLAHQVVAGVKRPRDFIQWRSAWIVKRLRAALTGSLEDRVAVEDMVDLAGQSEDERRLWRTHFQAWLQYQPRPYPDHIVLFRTRGHPLLCSFDPQMGWGSYAAGGVTIRISPGDHEDILEEKHAAHIARELKLILDEVKS